MKIFLLLAASLFVLFWAGSASSAESKWVRNCETVAVGGGLIDDTTASSRKLTQSLKPGQTACADSVTATDVTYNINVSQCNHVDVFQFIDPDGDDDDSTIVGQVQLCSSQADDDSSCADFGLTEFSGNDALWGLGAIWMRVEVNGTTDTAEARWDIHCVGNAQQR
jgi:hypothetical protein